MNRENMTEIFDKMMDMCEAAPTPAKEQLFTNIHRHISNSLIECGQILNSSLIEVKIQAN